MYIYISANKRTILLSLVVLSLEELNRSQNIEHKNGIPISRGCYNLYAYNEFEGEWGICCFRVITSEAIPPSEDVFDSQ